MVGGEEVEMDQDKQILYKNNLKPMRPGKKLQDIQGFKLQEFVIIFCYFRHF
jgi:hypothetical protein